MSFFSTHVQQPFTVEEEPDKLQTLHGSQTSF